MSSSIAMGPPYYKSPPSTLRREKGSGSDRTCGNIGAGLDPDDERAGTPRPVLTTGAIAASAGA